MTVKDAIRLAYDTNDYALAGRIVDSMRYSAGMNYREIQATFEKCEPGFDDSTFEDWMQELEARGL